MKFNTSLLLITIFYVSISLAENIEEKLKKHKLIGGRHKRTNKKNPPIV